MSPETLRLIADLVLPPSGLIIIIVLGLLFWLVRLRKTGFVFVLLGVVFLYLASSPHFSYQLIDTLQYQYKALKEVPEGTQAIVVLSGGRTPIAREYDSLDTVKHNTLERLRYASRLSKIYNLPVMLVGGSVNKEQKSEAAIMQKVLKIDFGVDAQWLETESKNTYENAEYATRILKRNSINKFLLVTHAYHMPRSMWCFEQFGFQPTPAPTIYFKRNMNMQDYKEYIPTVEALGRMRLALHEIVGKLWYEFVGV